MYFGIRTKKKGPAPIFYGTLILVSVLVLGYRPPQSSISEAAPKNLEFDNHAHNAFSELYNYNFHRADSISRLIANTQGTWGKIIRANYLWWMLMSGEEDNQSIRDEFTSTLNWIISQLKYEKQLDPKQLYCLIIAQALKARLNLMDGNYFKGIFNLDNTVHQIQRSLGMEIEYEPFLVTSGLLYYFSEFTPLKYPFTKLYFKGINDAGMAKGISVLKRASNSKDLIVNTEGNYFLIKIYHEVENKPALALPHLQKLCDLFSNNILYWYQLFDCLLGNKNIVDAKKVLSKIHFLSLSNKTLTINQQRYFVAKAQERLAEFYKTQK